MNYDLFNGDADGLCALLQLRLAEPREAVLVTGTKRDIELLARVEAQAGDRLTVLDISMAKNSAALERHLQAGASILYIDHHQAGTIPNHPHLEAHIDTAADTCTSLIVNRLLGGRFALWAVVAAFGDGLIDRAEALAASLALSEDDRQRIRQLGEVINYNGYGATEADLFIHPAKLLPILSRYVSPLAFLASPDGDIARQLQQGYQADMAEAERLAPMEQSAKRAIYRLPPQPWARRVSGVFANQLMQHYPDRAHVILSDNEQGGYLVSVRAPYHHRQGADTLCSQFASGGGRAGAAGINHLAPSDLHRFKAAFAAHYPD